MFYPGDRLTAGGAPGGLHLKSCPLPVHATVLIGKQSQNGLDGFFPAHELRERVLVDSMLTQRPTMLHE